MSIQQNQIVQPTYDGTDIFYRTPVDAIITDGMSLGDYIRNTTGVVESGSNANGNYIKFADGTMICQGSKTFTSVECTTGYGGLYRSGASNQMNDFPVEFYDIPIVHFGVTEGSASGNNGTTGPIVIVFMKINTDTTNPYVPTKTNPGRISIAVGSSQTISTITVSYTAVGRWKDYDAGVLPDAQSSTIINSSSTTYSTDEKVVGLWINNKPLYRKVFTGSSVASSLNTGLTTVESIVKLEMYVREPSSTKGWRSIPWLFNSTDTTWMGGVAFRTSDAKIAFQLGSALGNIDTFIIILEYTKTTDSPVTSQTKDLVTVVNGKNITDLETIIHQRVDDLVAEAYQPNIFSGDEVKTNMKWIDGRTIYRKTFTLNVGTATSYNIAHNLPVSSVNDLWVDMSTSFFTTSGSYPICESLGHYNGSTDYSRFYLTATQIYLTFGSVYNSSKTAYVTINYLK